MQHSYRANGKILLTSEFLILHGSKALAVPLTMGQTLHLEGKSRPGKLHWTAKYNEEIWFETSISLDNHTIKKTTSHQKSLNLINILKAANEISSDFADQLSTYDVVTNLEFDPSFGFGSSSTLTSLISQWAGIDPLQLHFSTSKGSGYDVACANAGNPILYQVVNDMAVVENIEFRPDFIDRMWLVYLGQKQDSAKSVQIFLNNYKKNQADVDYFTELTNQFYQAKTFDALGEIILNHEEKLSEILDIPPIKQTRFAELNGYVKSLGAWGGDFALLMTDWEENELKKYLESKGIRYWFSYKEIALQQ